MKMKDSSYKNAIVEHGIQCPLQFYHYLRFRTKESLYDRDFTILVSVKSSSIKDLRIAYTCSAFYAIDIEKEMNAYDCPFHKGNRCIRNIDIETIVTNVKRQIIHKNTLYNERLPIGVRYIVYKPYMHNFPTSTLTYDGSTDRKYIVSGEGWVKSSRVMRIVGTTYFLTRDLVPNTIKTPTLFPKVPAHLCDISILASNMSYH